MEGRGIDRDDKYHVVFQADDAHEDLSDAACCPGSEGTVSLVDDNAMKIFLVSQPCTQTVLMNTGDSTDLM